MNDRNLMECFVDNGYSGTTFAAINRCRLFLQVIHLSDVTTGDGKRICNNAYRGQKHVCLQAIYDWPAQGRPVESDWVEWRKALETTFCVHQPGLTLPTSYQLQM